MKDRVGAATGLAACGLIWLAVGLALIDVPTMLCVIGALLFCVGLLAALRG